MPPTDDNNKPDDNKPSTKPGVKPDSDALDQTGDLINESYPVPVAEDLMSYIDAEVTVIVSGESVVTSSAIVYQKTVFSKDMKAPASIPGGRVQIAYKFNENGKVVEWKDISEVTENRRTHKVRTDESVNLGVPIRYISETGEVSKAAYVLVSLKRRDVIQEFVDHYAEANSLDKNEARPFYLTWTQPLNIIYKYTPSDCGTLSYQYDASIVLSTEKIDEETAFPGYAR